MDFKATGRGDVMSDLIKHFSDARFLEFRTLADLEAFAGMLDNCVEYAEAEDQAALIRWSNDWRPAAYAEIKWRRAQETAALAEAKTTMKLDRTPGGWKK